MNHGGLRPASEGRTCANAYQATIAVTLTMLLGAAAAGVAGCGRVAQGARWAEPVADVPSATAPAPGSGTPSAEAPVITFAATGDIVLGDAPGSLPAKGGDGFFSKISSTLEADLVMGNLEEPLTEDTGYVKCRPEPSGTPSAAADAAGSPTTAAPAGAGAAQSGPVPAAVLARGVAVPARGAALRSGNCHQFRVPPGYADHLAEAGFDLLNLANNHTHDYGDAGLRSTRAALEKRGLAHTGAPGQITIREVRGVRVAVLGFSPYAWSNSVVDLTAARKLVRRAAERADLVVVQAHMGAEGADQVHVRPGTEMFLGENRGDPVRFAHAVVDAGADLVIGHGPHVLRAVEFYRGRLIAYSLGNFAGGGGTLSRAGRLELSAVLTGGLRADGTWASGRLISARVGSGGRPVPDPGGDSLALVRQLCRSDFPGTGPVWGADAALAPPS